MPSQKALQTQAMLSQGNALRGKKNKQAIDIREEIQIGSEINEIVTCQQKVTQQISQAQALKQCNSVVQVSTSAGNHSPTSSGHKSWADLVEEEERSEPVKKPSIWDNFDISNVTDAGFKLEYVTHSLCGNSPIIDIELEDISSEIDYWKNAVVCYVLGAHPPFTVIQGYIQRLWAKHEINKMAMLKNGIVLVRFDSEIWKNDVI